MAIGLSSTWLKNAKELGEFKKMFHCPYCGTRQGYGKSDLKKEIESLRLENKRLEGNVKWHQERRDQAIAEANHFRKSRDGMKGQLAKVKNRVKNGVCPCCNRSFSDLRRHMESKHPDYNLKEEPT